MHSNRKRARFETAATATASAPVPTTVALIGSDLNVNGSDNISRTRTTKITPSARTLSLNANVSGQSVFLTQSGSGHMGNNVFLTICDESTNDESQEYLIANSDLAAHIKQEHDAATQTATTTLPLQYRVVNQLQRQLNVPVDALEVDNSSSSVETLPAAMQLPSGCEIYLVKEYMDACEEGSGDIFAGANAITTSSNNNNGNGNNSINMSATVKLEPGTIVTSPVKSRSTAQTTHLLRSNNSSNFVNSKASSGAQSAAAAGTAAAQSKRFLLETYNKRDDKRRATHNEVERRRRDKINSWIFKLKEMLPTDVAQNGSTTTTTATVTVHCSTVSEQKQQQQQQQQQQRQVNNYNNSNNIGSRTPPSDSKSQILIKACEYIKVMQDEIKSLRECLTENENLRLCNERLQNELNTLKTEHSACVAHSSSNNNNISNNSSSNSSFNLTLNTLNANDLFGVASTTTSVVTTTSKTTASSLGLVGGETGAVVGSLLNTLTPTAYTKRELIIRDYVD